MHFSAEEIHKRIKNLRTQYGRIMKTPPSGSGVKPEMPRQETGFLEGPYQGA